MSANDQPMSDCNVAFVRGVLSSPAEVRVLASGDELAVAQLTTRTADGTATLPVVVSPPPAWLADCAAGETLVVAGWVRRRFFRAGGATGSRVEVVAGALGRGNVRRDLTRCRKWLEGHLDVLGT